LPVSFPVQIIYLSYRIVTACIYADIASRCSTNLAWNAQRSVSFSTICLHTHTSVQHITLQHTHISSSTVQKA